MKLALVILAIAAFSTSALAANQYRNNAGESEANNVVQTYGG